MTRPGGLGWLAAGNAAPARALVTHDHGATWASYETPVVAGSAVEEEIPVTRPGLKVKEITVDIT